MLLTDFKNDLLQSFCYALDEHLAPIFGTPDDMILARVVDVPVRFVRFALMKIVYSIKPYSVNV